MSGTSEEIVGEDKLSALPEELLVTILLLIPTKEAVATMFLSKRWRFVWTMMPRLKYKEIEDDDDESKKSVWWFLEKSMESHKAAVIEILCMELGPRCPIEADVSKWVAKAVDSRVRDLCFELLWSTEPTRLPSRLYSSETLIRLSLSHKILIDFPSFSSGLVSLRTLKLYYVVYKDEDTLIRLLSSCPVLKFLHVKRKEDDNVKKFTVQVPSLFYLIYNTCMLLPKDDNGVVDTGRSLVIDTPALKSCSTFGFGPSSVNYISIESIMPCIEEAHIDGVPAYPGDKFIQSFSSVLYLELALTNELMLCCSTIKFSRLITCLIYPCDAEWMDSLVLFLQNTPKLKFLTVDYELTRQPPTCSISWSKSSSNPECLSSSLEKFQLINYGDSVEEEELVEYILQNSRCLKKAIISLRSSLKYEEDIEAIIEELNAIPRVSITSQLLIIPET